MLRTRRHGFSLLEAVLALFLVGLTIGLIGSLFQRSFAILRLLDEKERARQASRMGLDRITSELREATVVLVTGVDQLEFEKIDPTRDMVPPEPPPLDADGNVAIPDNYVPPDWDGAKAYPDSARLIVRYLMDGENLVRTVRYKAGAGESRQLVVAGVNSFTCQANPDNEAEVDVTISVRDNRRVTTVSSRVLAPCIKVEFE